VHRLTTITTEDGRTEVTSGPVPFWLRALAVLLALAVIALAVVVILPLGLVLLALGAGALALARVRRWLRGARGPNGLLDGRRNVRVIDPGQPPDDTVPP
jgi:hypothetical protein